MSKNPGTIMALVGVTALVLAGAFYVHFLFLSEHCFYVGDGSATIPARASVQGKFCGEPDSQVSMVLMGFESAAIAALIAFVTMWQRARDWVGKGVALLVVPAVMGIAWGALALPPDTCSPETAAQVSAYDCATRVG